MPHRKPKTKNQTLHCYSWLVTTHKWLCVICILEFGSKYLRICFFTCHTYKALEITLYADSARELLEIHPLHVTLRLLWEASLGAFLLHSGPTLYSWIIPFWWSGGGGSQDTLILVLLWLPTVSTVTDCGGALGAAEEVITINTNCKSWCALILLIEYEDKSMRSGFQTSGFACSVQPWQNFF